MTWSTIDDAIDALVLGGAVLVIDDPGLTPTDLARPGHVMPERTGDPPFPPISARFGPSRIGPLRTVPSRGLLRRRARSEASDLC